MEVLETVLAGAPRPVALHEPRFAGHEWTYVKQCLDDGWVSSVGRFVDVFEERLAGVCEAEAAVAVVNGTAALHVALTLAGVRRGDEVLLPSLTFIATANAVSYCGAIPHFVDADAASLGIDPDKLAEHLNKTAVLRDGVAINRKTERPIRAVVPVDVFGHPADADAIRSVAGEFALTVIEDATESLGSRYRGRACGGLADIGVLSFNGNKIATTGGGGAIVTNDRLLAKRAKHLTTTAKLPHPWAFNHDEIGWNYRLPNINAAVGVAQLEQLDGFVASKRRLAKLYADAFAEFPVTTFVAEPDGATSNYWLNAILVEDERDRDAVLTATHDAGFLTRPAWTPLHQLAMYDNCPRADLAATESLHRRLVALPSSAELGSHR